MLQLCRVEVPDSGGNTARVLRLGRIFRVFWSKYQTNRLEALHLAAAGGHLGVVHALLSRQVMLTVETQMPWRILSISFPL